MKNDNVLILNFIIVLIHKILGKKTDFFLTYKYSKLKESYGKSCLDIGSGTGRFAKYLLENDHEVKAIDVVNKSEHPELGMTVFDGKSIPFGKDQFDTSILMFVLHHTNFQHELIEECKRVTTKTIIIGEDIIVNWFDQIIGNIHLGTSPWSKSKNGFKTNGGWSAFFEEHNLELDRTLRIPRSVYPVYPVTRNIYVLRVR